jgi:hypothetical protein
MKRIKKKKKSWIYRARSAITGRFAKMWRALADKTHYVIEKFKR